MDLRMPVLGGVEAAGLLRANSRLKQIPLVAMTASIMGRPERLLENGLFDKILHKPVRFDQLFTTLALFLKTQRESSSPEGLDLFSEPLVKPSPAAFSRLKPLEDSFPLVLQNQNFDEIAQFGQQLATLAQELGIKLLEDYGRNLLFLVQVFEIGQLTKRLADFPHLMAKLRDAP